MLRRDFVRAVITVSVAPRLLLSQQTANPAPPPPAPVPWTLGLSPKTPLPNTEIAEEVAGTEVRFFTSEQTATLTRLSDLLLPPIGEKPGAIAANTPVFLDFLIGNSPESRKKAYTGGLDWLDAEAQTRFKLAFAQLDSSKADSILKPWLRTWMSDHPPLESHADFVNIAHEDIRAATVNSKSWSDVPSANAQEKTEVGLYWSPIEPDILAEGVACFHISDHLVAAPKSTHNTSSYPR